MEAVIDISEGDEEEARDPETNDAPEGLIHVDKEEATEGQAEAYEPDDAVASEMTSESRYDCEDGAEAPECREVGGAGRVLCPTEGDDDEAEPSIEEGGTARVVESSLIRGVREEKPLRQGGE